METSTVDTTAAEELLLSQLTVVDKPWNPLDLNLELPATEYEDLFSDGKFFVPTKKSKRNQFLVGKLKATNYAPTEEIGTVAEANEKLKPFVIKNDLVWKHIPEARSEDDFPHERSVIEYFIEKLGITSLQQDKVKKTLYRQFDDNLKVEFQKINQDLPWTVDNTRIIDGKPADKVDLVDWAIKIRSKVIHEVTVRDHLFLVHLTYSNYLTQAVAGLPKEDPLYELLIPHVIGSIEKNSDAFWNLYSEQGLVGGAANLTRGQIIQEMKEHRQQWINSNTNTYKQWRKKNKIFKDTLYVKRGDHVYKHLTNYIEKYFKNNSLDVTKYHDFWSKINQMYGREPSFPLDETSLKDTIVEILWRIIYFHYQVGTVMPYLLDSNIIRWTPGKKPNKGVMWSLVISFSTSARQYQLISTKRENFRGKNEWEEFISNLKQWNEVEPVVEGTTIPAWIWELELSVAR